MIENRTAKMTTAILELENRGLGTTNKIRDLPLTIEIPEQQLMDQFVEELKTKGLEAAWQVGYATQIITSDWTAIVMDQKDVGRRIVTSYRRPESLKLDINSPLFIQGHVDAIKAAMLLSTFGSDEGFQATRELIEYNHRIDPIPLSNPPSPAMLCIQELKDRMAGINRPSQTLE